MDTLGAINRELPTWCTQPRWTRLEQSIGSFRLGAALNRDGLAWSNQSGAANLTHSTEKGSLGTIHRDLPTWRTQPRWTRLEQSIGSRRPGALNQDELAWSNQLGVADLA